MCSYSIEWPEAAYSELLMGQQADEAHACVSVRNTV